MVANVLQAVLIMVGVIGVVMGPKKPACPTGDPRQPCNNTGRYQISSSSDCNNGTLVDISERNELYSVCTCMCGMSITEHIMIGNRNTIEALNVSVSFNGTGGAGKQCVTLHGKKCKLHATNCNPSPKFLCRQDLNTTTDTTHHSTTDRPTTTSAMVSTSLTPTVGTSPTTPTVIETPSVTSDGTSPTTPTVGETPSVTSDGTSPTTPTVGETPSVTTDGTSPATPTVGETSSVTINSTALQETSYPETTMTKDNSLAEKLESLGKSLESLASIPDSEIGSKKFHESIDNASSSLAKMSAQVSNIEAAFLPITNNGKTATRTSDSRKVTLTSAIVSLSSQALKDVKSAALSVVSTVEVTSQISTDQSNESFIGTATVSVSLESEDDDDASFDLKGHPIQVELIHLHPYLLQNKKGNFKKTCVYYNDVDGDWLSDGCEVVAEGDGSTTCSCNHLTNFAVLMQIDSESNACDYKALDVLSVVGGVISIICLALTLCAFALLKMFKVERNVVHGNLAFALLVSQLVFLTGIDAVENQTACSVVAVFLHYFLLSSFSWMLIEGALLFVKAVYVFHRELHPLKLMALGWGMPLPVVAVTLAAVQADGYGNSRGCWLTGNVIWAFICPMTLIVTINTGFVIAVIRSYLRLKVTMNKTELAKIRGVLKALMVIQPLMGFTWLLGFGVSGQVIACILFVILNTLQGVFVFALYCVKTEEVQAVLKRFKTKISPRRVDHLPNQLQMNTVSADNSTQNTSCDRTTSAVPIKKKAGWI